MRCRLLDGRRDLIGAQASPAEFLTHTNNIAQFEFEATRSRDASSGARDACTGVPCGATTTRSCARASSARSPSRAPVATVRVSDESPRCRLRCGPPLSYSTACWASSLLASTVSGVAFAAAAGRDRRARRPLARFPLVSPPPWSTKSPRRSPSSGRAPLVVVVLVVIRIASRTAHSRRVAARPGRAAAEDPPDAASVRRAARRAPIRPRNSPTRSAASPCRRRRRAPRVVDEVSDTPLTGWPFSTKYTASRFSSFALHKPHPTTSPAPNLGPAHA